MPTIALLLQYLPSVLSGIRTLTDYFHKTAEALRQNKEMTAEQRASLDKLIAEAPAKDYWASKE